MKKKKNIETIISNDNKDYVQDDRDTMSGLCIKHNKPTNYRYNKDYPEYPLCATQLTCVYKEYMNNQYVCKYFAEHKK